MVTFIEKEQIVQEISTDSNRLIVGKHKRANNINNKLRLYIRKGQLFPVTLFFVKNIL